MQVYLSLGSNIEPRLEHLQKAIALIDERIGQVERISRIYQTAPWHCPPAHGDYLNLALSLFSTLEATEIMQDCLEIEKELGRDRGDTMSVEYLPRTIDIDILLIGDKIINHRQLIVPHPRMHLRRFVLTPLAEIASAVLHPSLGKSIGQLLEACQDTAPVSPIA